MTVAALIAQLTALPPELTVYVWYPEGGFAPVEVIQTEDFPHGPVVIIE